MSEFDNQNQFLNTDGFNLNDLNGFDGTYCFLFFIIMLFNNQVYKNAINYNF